VGDVTLGHWLLWICLPAWALTYGVVGSTPLRALRAALVSRFPRSIGALVTCPVCTSAWAGLLFAALDRGETCQLALVLGLAVAGAMWVFSSLAAGLARIARSLDAVGKAVAWRGALDQCADEKKLSDMLAGLEGDHD
jgi:hypothetical protein